MCQLLDPVLYRRDAKAPRECSALKWAALNGVHQTAEKAIRAAAAIPGGGSSDIANDALCVAVRNGHLALVKLLLDEAGADVGFKDAMGLTPLILAARYGRDAMVTLLLATDGVDAAARDIQH